MFKKLSSSLRHQEGATAVEYGLIVGLIAVAILVILQTTGTNLFALFSTTSGALATAAR